MTRRDLGTLCAALAGFYLFLSAPLIPLELPGRRIGEGSSWPVASVLVAFVLVAFGALLCIYRRSVGAWLFADGPGAQAPASEAGTNLALDLGTLGVVFIGLRFGLIGVKGLPIAARLLSPPSVVKSRAWGPIALALLCFVGLPLAFGVVLVCGRKWIVTRLSSVSEPSAALRPGAELLTVAFSLAGVFLMAERVPDLAYHLLLTPRPGALDERRANLIAQAILLILGALLVAFARPLGQSDPSTVWARLRGREPSDIDGEP